MPSQPGLHDPSWYEATLAERFIVEMLDKASRIRSVTIQVPAIPGIDDVMVACEDGRTIWYQVKHTRAEANLTFAYLANAPTDGKSLLRQLAEGWKTVVAQGDVELHLYTNRKLGQQAVRVQRAGVDTILPPLSEFWTTLSTLVGSAGHINEIRMPSDMEPGWQQWREELDSLSDAEQLRFLRSLHIDADQPSLPQLTRNTVERLSGIFGIPVPIAQRGLAQLDTHLRRWATSLRGNQIAVTREEACCALQIPGEDIIGDHDFPPPEPFFPSRNGFVADLAQTVCSLQRGIVFLTGSAGCGKTSIVSALANRAEPVVDLRFHAFRPLTPGAAILPQDYSQTATAAALWGDLLAQLRQRFYSHRLWEAGVPVRNDFLLDNPGRLREHVLRLARLLATDRGRPTVIAIDGLDHAARAKTAAPEQLRGRPSLLEALVPPEDVPEGVVFLIAGQPGWSRYPLWLRTPGSDVTCVDVPPLAEADIANLLQHEPGQFPMSQIDAAARVIAHLTQGNALAAVYAVFEARSMSDALALQQHLETRRLGPVLEDYYDALWNTALTRHQDSIPSLGARLATALATSTVRLTGALLRRFYADLQLSDMDWEEILARLQPILECAAGGYAIRHNDLRVYLMAQLSGNPTGLAMAAARMADYYITAEATEARHADLFRLLHFAGRSSELPNIFTPSYVVDAWAIGRPMGEILEQAQQALSAVTPNTGWDNLHQMALGLTTVQQLRSAVEYYSVPFPPQPLQPCLVSEARVHPRSAWSLKILEGLVRDAEKLIGAGEVPRARGLIQRWLGGLTPVDLHAALTANPGTLEPWEEREIPKRVEAVLRAWGRLAQAASLLPDTSNVPINKQTRPALAAFFGGWLKAGVQSTLRPWQEILQTPPGWFRQDLAECIEELAKEDRWQDLSVSLRHLSTTRSKYPMQFLVRAAYWAILAGADQPIVECWVTPIVTSGLAALASYEWDHRHDPLELYVATAFVLGYMQPVRPSGGISDDVRTAYFARARDERQDAHVSRLFFGAAWAGQFVYYTRRRSPNSSLPIDAGELRSVLRSLLMPERDKPIRIPQYFLVAAPRLVQIILDGLTAGDEASLGPAVVEPLLEYARPFPCNESLEVVWRALAVRGYQHLLHEWARHWIGDTGAVWRADLGGRIETVQRFAALARPLGWSDEVARAERRMRWNQVGYTGHKEYALAMPMAWFKAAARDNAHLWKTHGLRLLAISQEASRTGDNRMAIALDAAVLAAAAACGPVDLWGLARGLANARGRPHVFSDGAVFDGIITALENTLVAEEDLLHLWCAGIGGLIWQRPRDRVQLVDFREALLAASRRLGYSQLPEKLQAISLFETTLTARNHVYRFPSRWFRADNEDSEDEKRRRQLIEELDALPVCVAITELADRAYSLLQPPDLWRAVAHCARRLSREHPPDCSIHVRTLLEVVKRRPVAYTWDFDAADIAIRELIPLADEAIRWEICAWAINSLNLADADLWVQAAADNLCSLSYMRANNESAESRRCGLEREVRAHETWILGPRHENPIPWPTVSIASAPNPSLSWGGFAALALLELLRSGGAERVRSAAKGLYALLTMSDSINTAVVARWPTLDHQSQHILLIILEQLAAEHPNRFNAWRTIAEGQLASGHGADQVQAWVTLDAFARATNSPAPAWPISQEAPRRAPTLARPASRLIDIPADTVGSIRYVRGTSGVKLLARMLAHSLTLDQRRLEAAIAEIIRNLPPPTAPDPRDLPEGDMKLSGGSGVEEVCNWAVKEACAGSFGDLPPVGLAQAILPNDEPRLLTTSGVAADDQELWPIDQALEAVFATGNLEKTLAKHACSGLLEDEELLAAELHIYARDKDVVFRMAKRWTSEVLFASAVQQPSTFNGRTYLYYEPNRYEPETEPAAGWMTFNAGGLGMFLHAQVVITPTKLWDVLGWRPMPTNPFIWLKEGKPIVRFEVRRGPLRDTIQEPLYRQPVLLRWIINRQARLEAERILGVALLDFRTVEVVRRPA